MLTIKTEKQQNHMIWQNISQLNRTADSPNSGNLVGDSHGDEEFKAGA
jgi:hypothetical protein